MEQLLFHSSVATARSAFEAAAPRAIARSRMPLVDALRAFAATMIVWHHFAYYPPLADWAMPIMGDVIEWLRDYSRAAQVFFVITGYLMAQSAAQHNWVRKPAINFVMHRYCRLGLPYLAAVGLSMIACLLARNWLDEGILGATPSVLQVLSNVTFTQYILGYDSLSAGLWFVCINFQLSLLFLAVLYAGRCLSTHQQRAHEISMALGLLLSFTSLFYFNLDEARWSMWALYFFSQFFLGVVVYEALQSVRGRTWLCIYVLLIIGAVIFEWRWRLMTTLITGTLLFAGGALGFGSRWPNSRVIDYLGRISYSLFLIHFPVLIVVAMIWTILGWNEPDTAVLGLLTAYFASLGAAILFYRFIESPAARLSRRFG